MPTNLIKEENVKRILDFVYCRNPLMEKKQKTKVAKVIAEYAETSKIMLEFEIDEQIDFIIEDLQNV